MAGSRVADRAVTLVTAAVLIVLLRLSIMGKCAFLIAGYNALPKAVKAHVNKKELCRFVGKILMPMGAIMP